jgi:hypothetical protein
MAIAEKELVIKAGKGAPAAGKGAALTEVDLKVAAQPIIDELEARLTELSAAHYKEVTRRIKEKTQGQTLTDPISQGVAVPPYNWWDMLMVGPFQGTLPLGPFPPSKVIDAASPIPAFFVCALWRNPFPINWALFGPSASMMMSPLNVQVRLESINLTSVTDGPDFVLPPLSPMGPGPINAFAVPITFPAPPQGQPHLYEINMTADITGPVPGLPFAGYSTWLLDFEADLPFLFLPTGPAGLRHDVPARVLVYTA